MLGAYSAIVINTEPPGACVGEDEKALCYSTPCTLTYAWPDNDPTKEHRLLVAKPGYKVEVVVAKIGQGTITMGLKRAPEKFIPSYCRNHDDAVPHFPPHFETTPY